MLLAFWLKIFSFTLFAFSFAGHLWTYKLAEPLPYQSLSSAIIKGKQGLATICMAKL
jgi:hypothetical protein